MARHVTEPFVFRPNYLRPAELLLHACLMQLHGRAEMPDRPALCVPDPIEKNGQRFVRIHRLVEPARTSFVSWLLRRGAALLNIPTLFLALRTNLCMAPS
jgi:hypothetical protein